MVGCASDCTDGASFAWVKQLDSCRSLLAMLSSAVQSLVGAVKKLAADPEAKDKNRIGVLLGTHQTKETKTITHVMWVLFNLLPGKTTQKPHRHTPTALDFAVSAPSKGMLPSTHQVPSSNVDLRLPCPTYCSRAILQART